MQALRQIEATIDSVVSVLSNSIPGFVIASSSAADPQVGSSLSFAHSAAKSKAKRAFPLTDVGSAA